MSEEEIIKILKDTISLFNNDTHCIIRSDNERVEAMQGLLDLYNKEKEKNSKAIGMLKEEIKHCENENAEMYDKCHIQLKFNKHLLEVLQGGITNE